MSNLARPEKRAAARSSDSARTEYLAFTLAGDLYAVRIAMVAEILRPPPVTEVPRAPAEVLGVVSVRGRLVTVVDARRKLGLVDAPLDARTRILLVDVGGDEYVGLLVDEVLQVHRLGEDEIEPAAVLGGDQPPHILGIGRPDAARDDESKNIIVLVDVMSLIQMGR